MSKHERGLTLEESAALARGHLLADTHDLALDDPLARTDREFSKLIEESLTVDQVARRLGLDQRWVYYQLFERMLYGIKVESDWRIPNFQLHKHRLLPGLEIVIPALDPDLHPVAVATWFTTPNVDLVVDEELVSPYDWLRQELSIVDVAELAAAL